MAIDTDSPELSLLASKPLGEVARLLAEQGIRIRAIEADEGNVDRFVIGRRVGVERRTGTSLLAGIMDKTLFTSAIYLRDHFAVPIVLLEGQVDYEYRGFNPQAVRGAVTALTLEYGVSVLATPEPRETAAMLAMIARQETYGIPSISLIPKRKAVTVPDRQRRLVEMLPRCGMVLARELLQRFGSIPRLVAATEEELCRVPRIGCKTAREMLAVLHAEYEAVDTEKQLEDAIEAAPGLLFEQPVELLARQLHIYSDARQRHVVDMVFLDEEAAELILVELKRGRLEQRHVKQLRRYLNHAAESPQLNPFLAAGAGLRGILASVEPDELTALDVADDPIECCTVDRERAIAVLKQLRQAFLAGETGDE